MLYRYIDMNPFLLTMGIMPAIAVFLGISAIVLKKKYIAIVISFLLPLVFLTTNRETFIANLDAWLLWGVLYGAITYGTEKLLAYVRNK
ncbi:hypothetical protein [Pelosinus fermentans]|uniref:Uncharacterized protein n=1 Tax=Pelosinus fermentans JBW45 TaxID=1192197 RepID=I8TUS1_9FIRM|nr:hypothetical protein [Pelosinus fermentans]AJQ26661.1 hypothetical protein JBW_01309 [Pelosinus fermentans JBW45]